MLTPARLVLLMLLCCSIAGCAVRTHEIRVVPDAAPSITTIRVVDGRADKQLYMNAIAFGGQSSIYPLVPVPAIEHALHAFIGSAASVLGVRSFNAEPVITIEDIDIKNRVGFATTDDLSCRIESTVRIGAGSAANDRRVRSVTRNQSNMSPLVQTSAEVITRQCLAQHASDILIILVSASGV
jgi:hypothetical protein